MSHSFCCHVGPCVAHRAFDHLLHFCTALRRAQKIHGMTAQWMQRIYSFNNALIRDLRFGQTVKSTLDSK